MQCDVLLQQSENRASTDVEAIKVKLRRIANAASVEDVKRSVAEFEASAAFVSNSCLAGWFSNTWKPLLMARFLCWLTLVACFSFAALRNRQEYWRQRADERPGNRPPKVDPGAFSGQRQGWKPPRGPPDSALHRYTVCVSGVHCWEISLE